MIIQTYKKEVEAVYFDGINDMQEIATWCGGMIVELIDNEGKMRTDTYLIDVPCPGGYTTAAADFFIFKDDNSFFAMDRPNFTRMFESCE